MTKTERYRIQRRLTELARYIHSPAYAPTAAQLAKAKADYQALAQELNDDLLTGGQNDT